MNIDRHNYEEFFLLYVDNELSAAERKTVELFVQQNPDLHKELLMFQQSILPGDKIVFENKNELLKTGGFAELQEKLLLFTDDELSLSERKEIETVLASDTVAAAEWNILQQTKLQPDTAIIFADKQSLYRREGARVVGIKWWRVAAAAVLLSFGIWAGVEFYKNSSSIKSNGGEIVKGNKEQPKQNKKNEMVSPVFVEPQPEKQTAPETIVNNTPQKKSPERITEKNNTIAKKNNTTSVTTTKQKVNDPKDAIVVIKEDNKKPGNNLPKPLENINNNSSNKTLIADVQPLITEKKNAVAKNDIGVNKMDKQSEPVNTTTDKLIEPSNVYAKNALYSNSDEAKNDNKVLYMDEENVKRSKVGGFLRKLKRVIERNTNIKTGKGINVAGFEIAVK